MPDPFAQKVYLRSLAGTALHTRYSAGAQRRAAQLERFIHTVHETASARLDFTARPDLLVVSRRDWKTLFSYPYGFSFVRSTKQGSSRCVSIVAAADYPERLLHRFDAVKVRAAKKGVLPPGELREFFDLFIGQQWGHAALRLAGLRTRLPWLDDLLASCVFLLALRDLAWHDMAQRFLAWSELQLLGSGAESLPLRDFSYPRAKLKFERGLWFQGTLTLQANALVQRHGWSLLAFLKASLLSSSPEKPDNALGTFDPEFATWLSRFGHAPQDD